MDDNKGKEEEEYKPKSPNKKLTGKIKLVDHTGVGYIICDQTSDEYLITPSSFSNFKSGPTFKQGYFVKFTPTFRSSIPQLKAFNVVLIGRFKCFNCNNFGHLAYNCTLSNNVKCHGCGLLGHYYWDCINQVEARCSRGLNSKKNPTLTEDDDEKKNKGSGSMVCVKKREDVKKVEQVEDCFILDFDPTKIIEGVKLEKEDGYDDEGYEKLSSIVCVKKRGDVKKVEQVEDCFILEFDPDEPLKFNNLSLSVSSSDTRTVFEDDLSILAEKGQVACRDFPHPRHLCAKYPFNKTSHRIFCEKCYCYICDIPTPCSKWTWIEGPMHCHASDEEFMWKNMKQMQKRAYKV